MRRIRRLPLDARTETYLARKQAEVDASDPSADINRVWKSARQTAAMGHIERVLREMARRRQRCMYCEDSLGTDVEHFWPKAKYRERVFKWPNLLLVCGGCNAAKGDRFPRDASGTPSLIDPTAIDPWEHLFFDTMTGNIVARYRNGQSDPKGQGPFEFSPRSTMKPSPRGVADQGVDSKE